MVGLILSLSPSLRGILLIILIVFGVIWLLSGGSGNPNNQILSFVLGAWLWLTSIFKGWIIRILAHDVHHYILGRRR
jgi:uncharacterized RDD family membrane protein YckC